jgi:hypothetical protein
VLYLQCPCGGIQPWWASYSLLTCCIISPWPSRLGHVIIIYSSPPVWASFTQLITSGHVLPTTRDSHAQQTEGPPPAQPHAMQKRALGAWNCVPHFGDNTASLVARCGGEVRERARFVDTKLHSLHTRLACGACGIRAVRSWLQAARSRLRSKPWQRRGSWSPNAPSSPDLLNPHTDSYWVGKMHPSFVALHSLLLTRRRSRAPWRRRSARSTATFGTSWPTSCRWGPLTITLFVFENIAVVLSGA